MKNQYIDKIKDKITQMAGKPKIEKDGKESYLENTWTAKDEEMFLNWLEAQFKNDKKMYKAISGSCSNNTNRNCKQLALSFVFYLPKTV